MMRAMIPRTFAAVAALALATLSAPAAEPDAAARGWCLLWSEEFDGPAIDPALWRTEDAGLVKNNELQYYAPDEAFISDGKLVLRAQRRAMGGRAFTSGLVETKGRFNLLYGRVEFRMKIPRGQGFWPAVWMLPADGAWPPEIDITEHVGSQPNAVTMTLHYGAWPDHEWDTETHIDDQADYSADFHTYAIEWEPEEIRWYVDGVKRYATMDNVPQQPFYLIVNLAVGGDMPGDPDETTPFPSQMEVDYIRVFGKDIPGTFFLTALAADGRIARAPDQPRYKEGEAVALKAIPAIGYRFTGWSGDAEGEGPEIQLVMDRHRSIRARFEPDPDAPPRVSVGKPARATSVEEGKRELVAGNLTDGMRSTRWSSAFNDEESVVIDLGSPHRIKAIRLDWENAHGKTYDVQVSPDRATWTTVFSQNDGKGGAEDIHTDTEGRYVRLLGKERATEWGWSLFEIEVYGTPVKD
jgi:beta-glucanase (GH16 family)